MAFRAYKVAVPRVAVSATQDLLAIYTGTKAIRIREVTISQQTTVTPQNLPITLKRLGSAVTSGSGGSAATPKAVNPGDAAATATARGNDTTQASSSGTVDVLRADNFDPVDGFLYLPPEDQADIIGPNSAFVVSLDAAPSQPETMSATIVFEELF